MRRPHGGGRASDEQVVYPADAVAAKHGAGVESETWDPAEAYGQMGWAPPEPARRPWPPA